MCQNTFVNISKDENSQEQLKYNRNLEKSTVTYMKNFLMGSSIEWTPPRKESVSLKMHQ